MNKSEKLALPGKKTVKRAAAATAIALTAAMGQGVATANAETASRSTKLHNTISTRVLDRQIEESLRKQRDLQAFNGILLFSSDYNNGGTEYTPVIAGGNSYPADATTNSGRGIEHPIVVFRGNPKNRFGHNDLTNGDYEFGLIDRTTGDVKLIKFDPKNMVLVSWAPENESQLVNFIFQSDNGTLNFNEPLTSTDDRTRLHGGPLTDASGQFWQVGREISPRG
jgi:hypothetical protein